MHPLQAWLTLKRSSKAALARKAGLKSPVPLSKFLLGRIPHLSPEMARKIVQATDGEVRLEDLLFPSPHIPEAPKRGYRKARRRRVKKERRAAA